MDEQYQEVYFGVYCVLCKYNKLGEVESPCSECLEEPTNLYTHKPVKYEERKSANENLR